jgi:hypothetical protein
MNERLGPRTPVSRQLRDNDFRKDNLSQKSHVVANAVEPGVCISYRYVYQQAIKKISSQDRRLRKSILTGAEVIGSPEINCESRIDGLPHV